MKRILIDGWPVIHEPTSLKALHLLSMLAAAAPTAEAIVALPGQRPSWMPNELTVASLPTPNTIWNRLKWEQQQIPALARRVGASWIHTFSQSAPFLASLPTSLSATSKQKTAGQPVGLTENIRRSLAAGGEARARTLLWPAELDPPTSPAALVKCPPLGLPEYLKTMDGFDFPTSYVLYHGPGQESDLRRLLASWAWCAPSIGDQISLLLVGLSPYSANIVKNLAQEMRLADTVHAPSGVELPDLPAIYNHCLALFHPAESHPWEDPLILGLKYGKAAVLADTPAARFRAGPAAYLADMDNPRMLGAALLTILVDETVASGLETKAVEQDLRINALAPADFTEFLWPD